jgi:hypothetical protein
VLARLAHDPNELRRQIRDVVAYTKERFGEAKAPSTLL